MDFSEFSPFASSFVFIPWLELNFAAIPLLNSKSIFLKSNLRVSMRTPKYF